MLFISHFWRSWSSSIPFSPRYHFQICEFPHHHSSTSSIFIDDENTYDSSILFIWFWFDPPLDCDRLCLSWWIMFPSSGNACASSRLSSIIFWPPPLTASKYRCCVPCLLWQSGDDRAIKDSSYGFVCSCHVVCKYMCWLLIVWYRSGLYYEPSVCRFCHHGLWYLLVLVVF